MPLPTEVVEQRNLLQRAAGRLWSGLVAVWAAVTGLAPHVLHHVGPLAGAAIVSGIAGTALFGAIGFVATVPLLLRLHRRFGSWRAPAIALALFVTVFTASTILGPQLTGADVPAGTSTTDGDHEEHHP
jgi:hypothetical protein